MSRRIVVALDESAASRAALESAARFAAERAAELIALFVEDADLVSAASLPGSATISYQGASLAPLGCELLLRSLRLRARRLRDEVAQIAARNRIPWQFETIRGHVGEEVLRLAADSDMIAIGASSLRDRRGVYGSTARMILERASGSVLVVRRPLPATQRIAVMSINGQAREIGAALARMTGAALDVRPTPPTAAAALDQLSRIGASYLVVDRASLARLKLDARFLAERLQVEGILVTG
jgi:nucleotide-binding universal stress UspA family protein